MKKFALAFLAYVALVISIAIAWHYWLFKEAYVTVTAHYSGVTMFQFGTLSVLIQAAIVAYLYPRFAKAGSPAKEGLRFGLLLGILLGSIRVLAEAANYDVGLIPTFLIYEGAFFLILYVIVGVVIGLIYGKSPKER